jgi:hypothetical protein
MFRYLKEAFWARPVLWGVGPIPWNILALGGATALGFTQHAIWIAAAGAETLYLYAVSTHPRFRDWVDNRDLLIARGEDESTRLQLMQSLQASAKRRVQDLEKKIATVSKLYRQSETEDFLFDSNLDALRKLASLYLRLLVAQRTITKTTADATVPDLQRQVAAIEQDLAKPDLSSTLRESKQATLQLLEQRLRNLQQRDDALAEIDSDLARIEAQVDLAVEDAMLRGRPSAISSNIDLVSHLLEESIHMSSSDAPTTTTTSPNTTLEN